MDAPTADAPTAEHRATHMTHWTHAGEALHWLARQKLVAATLWSTFGYPDVARLSCRAALHSHALTADARSLSAADVQIAVRNMARTVVWGSFSSTTNTNTNTTPLGNGRLDLAMEQIARARPETTRRDKSKEPVKCIYGVALETIAALLDDCGGEATPALATAIHLDVALIAHELAVMRGDYEHAEALYVSMQGHVYAAPDQQHPQQHALWLAVQQQHGLLLSRQGHAAVAVTLLQQLIRRCEQQDPTRCAALWLQLALTHLEAQESTSSMPRPCVQALAPLTACLAACQEHAQDGWHAMALAVWAQLHVRWGHAARALAVLRSVLPTLRQCGHVWMQAEAYWTAAQAHGQLQQHKAACRALQHAAALFTQCQDYQRLQKVYYTMAQTAHVLQNVKLREEASQHFLRLSGAAWNGSGEHDNDQETCEDSSHTSTTTFMTRLTTRHGLEMLARRPCSLAV